MTPLDTERWSNFVTDLRRLDLVHDVQVISRALPIIVHGILDDGRPFRFTAQGNVSNMSAADSGADPSDDNAPGYTTATAPVLGGADTGPTRELVMIVNALASRVS